MSNGRCGTCMHWGLLDYPFTTAFGTCRRIVGPPDHDHSDIAQAHDGSDYCASVRCKAAFGCVLYEEHTGDRHRDTTPPGMPPPMDVPPLGDQHAQADALARAWTTQQ